jgi:hypothetical protein
MCIYIIYNIVMGLTWDLPVYHPTWFWIALGKENKHIIFPKSGTGQNQNTRWDRWGH